MTLYPDGYGTAKLSLDQMKLKHGVKMHPEFAKRFFAYMEYKGGVLGVGGGWRSISNISDASAAGKSFHQDQRFASGRIAYAAVDLVALVPGAKHRAPTWAETADAPAYGLHTFIKVPDEPWHIQCIEMRGWQTWVNAGRPDPAVFTLPGTTTPPPPIGVIVTETVVIQDRIGGDDGFVFGPGVQLVRVPQAAGKKAVTVALTVVTPNHSGWVKAYYGPEPQTAAVNYNTGLLSNGTITVAVDGDGWFALQASGFVRVIVDLQAVHS